MRALVTGAGGQLGRELERSAPTGSEVEGLPRARLDITDSQAVEEAMAEIRPRVLINAAAFTAVDRAEAEEAEALRVNGDGAGHLAAAARRHGVRMVHVSTDFVFAGESSRPYPPEATPAPAGAYGRSKLAGEERVRKLGGPESVIVRTSWVYSRYGANFVRNILRLLGEREEIGVVADQVGSPTWAAGLARFLWAVAARPDVTGVLHWCDAGVASWYDFAVAIREEAMERGLVERPAAIRPIASEEYPTAARRPSFSVLDCRSSRARVEVPAEHWRVNLRRMLDEPLEAADA